MAGFPESAVIVGGSLAGLMHGIYLKRHGVDVVILEQDPSSVRKPHNAGIGFGPQLEEFLRDYDLSKIRNCTPAAGTRIAWRKRKQVKELKIERNTSSWGLVYRILRANFDGLPSDPIPDPPKALGSDGRIEYRAGKKVTKLTYEKGLVTVDYVGVDGTENSITTGLVIGADGLNSTVRTLVNAPAIKEYSGYVSWRGVVPECEVSPEAVKYFENRNCLNLLKRNYIVAYIIPSDSGSFAPGDRVINFLWYWPYAEGSQELKAVLTDINGKTHSKTVPAGLVKPEIWSKLLADHLHTMASPYAELLSRCKNPFITKVDDALVTGDRATFHDGRVVLVGDALATFRPHIAMSTENAAGQVLDLGKVWKREMTLREWEGKVLFAGKKLWLVSRAVGIFGVCGWWPFVKILAAYVSFLVRGRRSKL
ncbi:hypothetical protein GE09DRAFT_1170812 [Coniochaeta sp. 2T2.1]|nr:hypothetical protein GE09DRAFT_1170812 [Coniochaeta sp. 2T2.1]